MSRRKFLRAGVAAVSMALPYSWALRAAAAPAGKPGPLKQRGVVQPFDYAMYASSRAGVASNQLPPSLGFAGFRILFHTDWTRDVAAFQGASYFRAVDGEMQFGMSQRGLAVDCGLPTPEEFPDFIAYYLERPPKDASRMNVYGLLDSPSVAGAYRF